MTAKEIKADLDSRGVSLRTHRGNGVGDGVPIIWKYARGGDYLVVPKADYQLKMHDIVVNHPNLTQGEKDLLDQNFVYAVAWVDNPAFDEEQPISDTNKQKLPYLDLTIEEFDVLYNNVVGQDWRKITSHTDLYKVVELPRMFDRTGERSLIYLFGKGYSWCHYGLSPAVEDFTQEIEPVPTEI